MSEKPKDAKKLPLLGELANAVSLRGFTLPYIYHLFIDNKPHFAVN